MEKINKVCKQILKLTETDFEEAEQIIKEQLQYCHPFKNGKAERLNSLGDYNANVVTALKTLYNILKTPPCFIKD